MCCHDLRRLQLVPPNVRANSNRHAGAGAPVRLVSTFARENGDRYCRVVADSVTGLFQRRVNISPRFRTAMQWVTRSTRSIEDVLIGVKLLNIAVIRGPTHPSRLGPQLPFVGIAGPDQSHAFFGVFGADALRFGDCVASSIHVGAWSLVPGLALTFRSTPAATSRFAAGALSSK